MAVSEFFTPSSPQRLLTFAELTPHLCSGLCVVAAEASRISATSLDGSQPQQACFSVVCLSIFQCKDEPETGQGGKGQAAG